MPHFKPKGLSCLGTMIGDVTSEGTNVTYELQARASYKRFVQMQKRRTRAT